MRLLIALLLTLAAIDAAFAFGTVRKLLGQDAQHERITRAALSFLDPKTLDELAGKNGTFGAVGAPDRPGRDLDDVPEAHCDGGDYLEVGKDATPYPQTKADAQAALTKCRDFIFKSFDRAVALAGELKKPDATNMAVAGGCPFDGQAGSAKCRVLDALGLALHASQDFYSHTNWTDKLSKASMDPKKPVGLGKSGPAEFIDPIKRAPIPSGLISGCYDGWPEEDHCTYGGFWPFWSTDRIKHDYLNKDKGAGDFYATALGVMPERFSVSKPAGTTSRGKVDQNYARAVEAAMADTRLKWSQFEAKVNEKYGAEGKRIMCALKKDDPRSCPDVWAEYKRICAPLRDAFRPRLAAAVAECPQCQGSRSLEEWEEKDGRLYTTGSVCGEQPCPTVTQYLETKDVAKVEKAAIWDAQTQSTICRMVSDGRRYNYTGATAFHRSLFLSSRLKVCAAAVRVLVERGTPVPPLVFDTCN